MYDMSSPTAVAHDKDNLEIIINVTTHDQVFCVVKTPEKTYMSIFCSTTVITGVSGRWATARLTGATAHNLHGSIAGYDAYIG